MADAAGKARTRGRAKLTEYEVLEIREMRNSGLLAKEIAQTFGISEWAVYDILRGRNWGKLVRLNVDYEERHKTHSKDHLRSEHGFRNSVGRMQCRLCLREQYRDAARRRRAKV
jgi:predicted DNA-binding protein YlxM (UPF0122 family)